MNKAMKSAQHGQDPSAGISLNTALRVAHGYRDFAGSCNACTDGQYKLDTAGKAMITEVQIRNYTFRLCQRCRVQLKGSL